MTDAVELESFDHVGLVVKSREATIKSWADKMGVGPWKDDGCRTRSRGASSRSGGGDTV